LHPRTAAGRVRDMRHRRPVTVLLVPPLLGLAALAYAIPPDPTWIGGLYDNADYDDIVIAVYGMDSPMKSPTPTIPKPLPALVGAAPVATPAEFIRATLRAPVVRAPPNL
jgi:hypothetical protein